MCVLDQPISRHDLGGLQRLSEEERRETNVASSPRSRKSDETSPRSFPDRNPSVLGPPSVPGRNLALRSEVTASLEPKTVPTHLFSIPSYKKGRAITWKNGATFPSSICVLSPRPLGAALPGVTGVNGNADEHDCHCGILGGKKEDVGP